MSRSFAPMFFLWAFPALAQPWVPSECGGQHEQRWRAYDQAIRTAPPASDLYVPRPFPRNEADIVADLVFGYERMWRGTPLSELPADELPLFEKVRDGDVSYRILRVENWTPTRCLQERRKSFQFLLYAHDRRTGEEVGRFVLNETGLLAGWTTPPEERAQRRQFLATRAPETGTALADVKRRFGLDAGRPQLVATWGSLSCSEFSPCMAFQAAGRIYLYHLGNLFEYSATSRTYSRSALDDRSRGAAVLGQLKSDERLTSIGAERFVVVRQVPPGGGAD